jgi:CBS domain containing-hemolysin-like protein
LSFLIPLLLVNALFVMAEFSVVALRRSRVHQLVDEGSKPAIVIQRLQRQIDRFLSATQIGITLASVTLGWVGKENVTATVQVWLGNTELSIAFAPLISLTMIVYLQIVLGELVPKSVALIHAENLALWLARPSEIMMELMGPFLWLLSQSSRLLLRAIGVEYSPKSWYSAVSAEELQRIITTSTESSGLEAEERQLLKNVFEFSDITAGEVMIPRTNIAYLEVNHTIRDLFAAVAQFHHRRYPVIGESLDDIRGIVDLKEIISKFPGDIDQPLSPFIRPVRFVSEDLYLAELLPQMQRSNQQMVMVVDEYGGTAGLVTMTDIIREILGNSNESPSQAVPEIKVVDERTFLVQAQASVEEVNETLGLDIPLHEDYQTLGGFVMFHLQRIPTQGEQFIFHNLEITIASMNGPRIDRVRICAIENPKDSDS